MSDKGRRQSNAPAGAIDWDGLWPEVERHLKRVLRFRLPAGSEPADVIQETAARLHVAGHSVRCREDVLQLATRVAINISIDLQRRSRVVAWSPLTTDVRASDDVEREVVARAELTEICRRMSVTPEELDRLLHCEAPEDRTASAKSRRYRSRQRMRRIRDALGGLVGIPRWHWLLGGAAAAVSLVPSATSPLVPSDVHHAESVRSTNAEERSGRAIEEPVRYPDLPRRPSQGPQIAGLEERGSTYKSQFRVQAPNGAGLEKGTGEHPGGQPSHLACVRNVAPLSDTCVPHPLRE